MLYLKFAIQRNTPSPAPSLTHFTTAPRFSAIARAMIRIPIRRRACLRGLTRNTRLEAVLLTSWPIARRIDRPRRPCRRRLSARLLLIIARRSRLLVLISRLFIPLDRLPMLHLRLRVSLARVRVLRLRPMVERAAMRHCTRMLVIRVGRSHARSLLDCHPGIGRRSHRVQKGRLASPCLLRSGGSMDWLLVGVEHP